MDDEIWVRPKSELEALNVIPQNFLIRIQNGRGVIQLRVELFCILEQIDRETGEYHTAPVHLCRKAGELVDLFGAQVGLDIALEGCDQLRDGRHDGGLQVSGLISHWLRVRASPRS